MTDTSSDSLNNPLEMSDEDFLKQLPAMSNAQDNAQDEAEDKQVENTEEEIPEDNLEEKDENKSEADENQNEENLENKEETKNEKDEVDPSLSGSPEGEKPSGEETKKEEQPSDKTEAKVEEKPEDKTEVDHKAFYEQIMKPFKANGKTIELRTPEEAIQLMQMGANYTRKMQDIQPHRKVLTMLQNNDLLNEDKLDYLISLDKKDPEAIKKLIKDAGIDPVDIDMSTDSNYLGGNHVVTDEHVKFQSTVQELGSTDTGRETLTLIDKNWDDTSKEFLWKNPEVMTSIHEQRESGVYQLIVDEVERQRTLGNIAPNTPFMKAYTQVGDAMVEAAKNGSNGSEKPNGSVEEKPEPKLIETRAATPKQVVKDGDKVSAASPTRSTPKTAKALVNPLEMKDDEFLKMMENRV